MKLEYLYTDDSYKEKIADLSSDSITLSEKKKDNLFIFELSIEGKSNDKAKKLSEIHASVLKRLDGSKLFVLLDDAAEHFDEQLYPLINKFERLFRKVIAIIANQKLNEEAIRQARELELLDFGQIYTVFFTDSNFLTQTRTLINKTPLSKKDLLERIRDEKETTLWKELFGSKYSEIPNSFFKIKDARNDVMHAHNISYMHFSETKSVIVNAISVLERIIEDILTDKAQIKVKGVDYLTKTVESISKLFTDNVLGKYQQQVDSISKSLAAFATVPNLSATLQIPKIDLSTYNTLTSLQLSKDNNTINTITTDIPLQGYYVPNTFNFQSPKENYNAINTFKTLNPQEGYSDYPNTIKISKKEDDALHSFSNLTVGIPEKEKKDD